jgi:hypothetical protein
LVFPNKSDEKTAPSVWKLGCPPKKPNDRAKFAPLLCPQTL